MDSRAAGLLHLIKLLDNMHDPPKFLFLENVPGFETSECHKLLTNVLKRKDYQIEEYMLMPTDPAVGIPNRRRRYYLSAKLSTTEESAFIEDHIITSFAEIGVSNAIETKTLLDFYKTANDSVEEYLVPLDFIRSAKDFRFDIVDPVKDVSCATFTKAYGSKYVIGTGSFIHTRNKDIEKYQPDDQSILPSLGLRFFAPMEIAELHAFPVPANAEDKDSSVVSFQFPDILCMFPECDKNTIQFIMLF